MIVIAIMMKARKRKQKRSKEAKMIIIDEEDQSSLMLSMMLASMLILDSSIFFSLGFALSPLAFFFITPAHLVFSLRLRLLELFRLAGVAFQIKGLSGVWIELALSGRANKNHGENVLSVTIGIAFCVSIVACRTVVTCFTSGPGMSPRIAYHLLFSRL